MRRTKHSRLGEKHITNEGYEVEIIEYFKSTNCTIQFNDYNKTVLYNIQFSQIKNGHIKNPYHKSICNVGYLGVEKYNVKVNTKAYNTWNMMLYRCYNKNTQDTLPTYNDVSVCEKWHNFQNFTEWFEDNYINNFHLDKDVLIKGNKVYSPETCAFIPQEINKLFTKNNIVRGELPIGVHYNKALKNKYVATLTKNSKTIVLGYFSTPKEAFQAYKTAKEQYIKEVANKWRGQITEEVYQAMYEYKVEITD